MQKPVSADQKKLFGAISMVALLAIMVIVLAPRFMQPSRSVAAYCKVYGQEKMRLDAMSNSQNPYPSGIFNVNVSDAGQIATSLGRLDQVAPNEIEPSVKTLEGLYQKIHDDPSQAIASSLSGGSVDDSLKAWTLSHCK